MRKSKINLNISEEVFAKLFSDFDEFGNIFDQTGVKIPEWSKMLLCFMDESKLEINFFEDINDYLIHFIKRITISNSEFINYSYIKKPCGWTFFDPPCLIGLDLVTKLKLEKIW